MIVKDGLDVKVTRFLHNYCPFPQKTNNQYDTYSDMNPFSAFLQYIQLALHNSLLNILKHEFRSTLEKTNALTQRLNQSPNQEQTENVFYFIP